MTTDPNPARPAFRDSSAVILLRGHGLTLEVFWVRRSDAVSYMPEFHAFPGGSVSRDDPELPVANVPDERERVLRACAIREAFEETGVLLTTETPPRLESLEHARARLLSGETFTTLAREHGWRFDGSGVEFAGRWTTPPFASVRFDTSFFIARMPAEQEPIVHPGELASGEWIAPAIALERWQTGEVAFAAPILHMLREVAAGGERLAERLASAPERAGTPVRRIELKWGIVLQPMKTRPLPPATHTNAYLVGEGETALIDPGSGDESELAALFALIDTLRADGRKLAHVLVTHHHPDHVGGVDAVRERYGVPVAAHAETAKHLRVDRMLEDGDRIALAWGGERSWSLVAMHTPGHTRGHLCFLEPRTRSLFTGDHVTGGAGTVIIDPPEGDMAAYLGSLERLLAEPVDTLFPAHGSPQGAAKRRMRWLMAHRLKREAKVLMALGPEPRSLAELVPRAYEDTPRELWPYAERSLLAHLLKLEGEGRAGRQEDAWASAPAPSRGRPA